LSRSGVEAREDGTGDVVQLLELLGRQRVDHEVAHGVDVSGARLDEQPEAGIGDRGVRGAAILRAREAPDEASILESAGDVREAGEGRVRARGELGHAHRAIGHVGECHERDVLEVGEPVVALELRVEGHRQQLGHGDQSHPGSGFLGAQWLGCIRHGHHPSALVDATTECCYRNSCLNK
jgi:hypothetical protein